jgi:hypothetical protein
MFKKRFISLEGKVNLHEQVKNIKAEQTPGQEFGSEMPIEEVFKRVFIALIRGNSQKIKDMGDDAWAKISPIMVKSVAQSKGMTEWLLKNAQELLAEGKFELAEQAITVFLGKQPVKLSLRSFW